MQNVANDLGLRLGKWFAAFESFGACIRRRPNFTPMIVKISITIRSYTTIGWIASCLSPESLPCMSVFITIGIDHRQNHPVVMIQKTFVWWLNKLVDYVQSHCWCNPLTSVNAGINEDYRFVDVVFSIGDSNRVDLSPLEGFSSIENFHCGLVSSRQILQVIVNFIMTMEISKSNLPRLLRLRRLALTFNCEISGIN